MNKRTNLFLLIVNIIFLTGCWSYNEINDLAIISGFSVDKDEKGNYILNAEIIEARPSKLGIDFEPNLIEATGESIFDAVRNLIALTTRRQFWSHTSRTIVSKEVAKEGILPIVDWITRYQEPRLTMHLYISKEKTAKEVLLKGEKFTTIRSFEFESIIKANRDLAKSPHLEVYQLNNQLGDKIINPVLPTVELALINNTSTIKLGGSAFFKSDKMVGYLDPVETMKYHFIVDEIKGGVIVVNLDKKNNKDRVTLQIVENKSKIKVLLNDELSIIVDLHTVVDIDEIEFNIDYTSKQGRIFLKEKAEEKLESEIGDFIRKTQKEYGLDVFGFGNIIKKKYPSLWKSIEKDWDTIYKDLNIRVESNIRIRNSGHITRPVNSGD